MKICKHCQAENAEEMNFCIACGEALEAEEETVEAVEEAEAAETVEAVQADEEEEFELEAPVESEKKKSYVGLIAVLVLVVLLVVAVIVGKGQYDKKQAEKAAAELAAQQAEQEAAQEEAESNANGQLQDAHHVNAFGYNSHSIHYTAGDNGSFNYNYQNENGENVPLTEAEVEALLDQEVAAVGDLKLTNRELLYYYDEQYYTFYNTYGAYVSAAIDTTLPLDEQLGLDGVNTWEQSFVNAAVNMFHQTAAIYAEAQAAGFELSEEDKAMNDQMRVQLDDIAYSYGYESAEDYLKDYYGPAGGLDSYMEFFERSLYCNMYLTKLMDEIQIDEQAMLDYYAMNSDMMVNTYGAEMIDQPMVNVRHILIQPESTTNEDASTTITDEAWAAASAEAERIYNEWKSGDATEDTFAALAEQYTQDPGSASTGGLYEDVYPGQMVTEFNDWCFDESRQVGDTAIVQTSYGYHIMFFSGVGDEIYWRTVVSDLMKSETMNEEITNMTMAHPLTSDYSKAILLTFMTANLPTAEEEVTTETTTEAE